ncbi:fibronectin type III domain-containing protein [Polluticoccus soli]|uniref:fibronectin type III domain-containing protein n=1 Tax=Polluticoccus soli TaxID=3034150 RepID=UPI0023E24E25|nr:T9SS type A sorting domain-containing protein [Flavipsychrobacter sp. JY13-12]
MCLIVDAAHSQQTAIIGAGAQSGTSSNSSTGDPGPVYRSSASSSNDYSRHHYLYTQSELTSAGITPGSVITKLAWYKANSAASNGNYHFEIWIKNSSLTSVPGAPQSWSTLTTSSTQVYNTNSQTMASATGFIDYTFTTPFTYTGGALEISVHHNCSMISGSPFNNGISWNKDPISNRTISYTGTSNSTTLSYQRTVRPQLRITYNACSAPTGLSVSNITPTSAVVSWNTVSGSAGYEYVVDQTATSPTGTGTSTSAAGFNASGLQQNTTYYVHLRNKCSSSNSAWVTVQFATLTNCYPPTNIVASNLTGSTGTLSWIKPAVSTGFEYKIDQVTTNPGSVFQTTTTPVVNFTGHTPGQTYYAHVRNVCAATDKSNWISQSFTMPECKKPTNVLISNITDSSANVLWSLMPNSGGFEYAVNFSNQPPTSGITSTTNISAQVNKLMPNSKYYFHLRNKCFAVDKSGWRLDSFVTKMVCYGPIVQVNNLGTNQPYAFWDPVPTAVGYEYATTSNAVGPAFGATIYTEFVELELPADGKDYYLHVRTKCNSIFTSSAWSTVQLRTGATRVQDISNAGLHIYPNPANDVVNVQGIINGEYSIISATGQLVQEGKIEDQRISISQLPTGVYILRLNSPVRVFRLIKQ